MKKLGRVRKKRVQGKAFNKSYLAFLCALMEADTAEFFSGNKDLEKESSDSDNADEDDESNENKDSKY